MQVTHSTIPILRFPLVIINIASLGLSFNVPFRFGARHSAAAAGSLLATSLLVAAYRRYARIKLQSHRRTTILEGASALVDTSFAMTFLGLHIGLVLMDEHARWEQQGYQYPWQYQRIYLISLSLIISLFHAILAADTFSVLVRTLYQHDRCPTCHCQDWSPRLPANTTRAGHKEHRGSGALEANEEGMTEGDRLVAASDNGA